MLHQRGQMNEINENKFDTQEYVIRFELMKHLHSDEHSHST